MGGLVRFVRDDDRAEDLPQEALGIALALARGKLVQIHRFTTALETLRNFQ
jgi:hypothetical protein